MEENRCELTLSKRLEAVASYIPEDSRLADIGSDHAYLPIATVQRGKVGYAVAGEVVQGPFEKAFSQVREYGLCSHIDVRLANGLDAMTAKDAIDVITVAGMGGVLIAEILERGIQNGRLQGNERLILQPNVGEEQLRVWLMKHDYQILTEELLEENQKFYEIIVAEKGERVSYSEKELFFGPWLLKEKSEIFCRKWTQELSVCQRVRTSLKQARQLNEEKLLQVTREISWIEEVLVNVREGVD